MNDKPHNGDAFLPLPTNSQKPGSEKAENPAANLIRQRVEEAYSSEPDAGTEVQGAQTTPPESRSKHQQFIYELTNSGKSVPEIQVAWHDYYAALSDVDKHQVWQEFYATQASGTHPQPAKAIPGMIAGPPIKSLSAPPKRRSRTKSPIRSLVFGLGVGAITILIALFGLFNERFIAPFIQPSRSLSNVPLITNTAIGPNPEIIIPKINVQIPVVYGMTSIEEPAVQKALENGVLHYGDTALPGQNGNLVIVGHSSNNIFNKGRYKFAFVLLSRLEPGDTFYLQKDGKRYTYEVYQKKIVKPSDVSVLGSADRPATASLITCDPPGTSINRLVVTGEQISPDPSKNKPGSTSNSLATQSKIIPSNAQSLWSRLWSLLSR